VKCWLVRRHGVMKLLIALILVFTTVIECDAEEASVVPDVDSPSLSSEPEEPEESAAVELPPSSTRGDEQCATVTSAHLFLCLLHLQCPASRDLLCVLGWPYDVKPPSNKFRCGRGARCSFFADN
jgi:hypothetical protein